MGYIRLWKSFTKVDTLISDPLSHPCAYRAYLVSSGVAPFILRQRLHQALTSSGHILPPRCRFVRETTRTALMCIMAAEGVVRERFECLSTPISYGTNKCELSAAEARRPNVDTLSLFSLLTCVFFSASYTYGNQTKVLTGGRKKLDTIQLRHDPCKNIGCKSTAIAR